MAQHIYLPLAGHGEMIGFLCLERDSQHRFEQSAIDRLEKAVALLATLVADQGFSIRVYQLAEPFEFQQPGDSDLGLLYEEIVDRTALAFAADAVALRIYDPATELLEIKSKRGYISDDLLVDRLPGEHIAGMLLIDPNHDWAAITDYEGDVPTGMNIADEDRQGLRRAGVHGCLIMRLASRRSEDKQDERIGTLAYHIGRPHRFSWRDLALFRLYCQRVANAIALERQTMRLRKSQEALELEHMLLLQQSSQVTHTDIISLIAHDLFHKAFNACATLQEYTDRVEKALRVRPGDSGLIQADGERAMDAAEEIQRTLGRLRTMQQSTGRMEIESSTTFLLKDIVDEIETVLDGSLSRNKITIRRNFADAICLFGPRSIFSSVMFNLTINAIDAGRSRTNRRPMAIDIQACNQPLGAKGSKLVIQFSDEGPGINRQVFRDPQEIFQIGRTTKVHGTGTGLPVARHLLQKHFDGNIELVSPEPALFRLTIPVIPARHVSAKGKK
jgi:signal transduction histidine kinase